MFQVKAIRMYDDTMKKKTVLFILLLLAACLACVSHGLGEAGGEESILVVSDAHLTEDARRHAEMMEAVIRAAYGRSAVLLLGDNTNNSHAGEHALALQWARTIERRTGAEVFVIPGNHDYGAHTGPEEFRALYGAYGWDRAFSRDTATASYAAMTENGTCLLLLDTNRIAESRMVQPDGGITADMLRWVREVLDALPDGTPVIACGHHPILPPDRNGRTPGADALSRTLRACGVGLYLCGHDHGFAATERDALRQITVGQPQAYPGWAGIVEKKDDGFLWHTEQIYDPESAFFKALLTDTRALARSMGQGTLSTTPYAGDEGAIEWFAEAFMAFVSGEMTPETCAAMLADDNCRKWREVETRTVVKRWILGLLENCPEDVRQISIPGSRKHPAAE